MRLQNKVIIVTGSTTGIGKAIALRCISEGAKVVIHGLENDLGKAVMSEAGNDHVVLHIEDITNNGAAERLVDIAVKTFGKLDAVVNNAAAVVSSNIETTDAVFLEEVLRINLVAPFALIRAALPHLSKTKGCSTERSLVFGQRALHRIKELRFRHDSRIKIISSRPANPAS